MSITELFNDVIYLSWEELDLSRPLMVADILPSDRLLIRCQQDKVIIHYLTSSDQIIIPGEYINLFLAVDRLLGEHLKEPKTDLETYLFLGSRLSRMIYGGNKENMNTLLSRMVKLGSKNLRRYLLGEFNHTLNPWVLRNIHNTVEV